MSISTPFIQRPIATSLLMAGIFLAGLVTFPMLPVAPLPQVDFPTIQVSASLPGASPETMASSVAQPLETQFSQIAGVTQMTSSSVLSQTQIALQFELGRSIDAASQDVQNAIDAASGQLPTNLPSPPSHWKTNPADAPILMMAVSSDVLPTIKVDDYAETIIAPQISRIPGVGLVFVGGQQKPAVRIQVDPAKLANMGVQLEDLAGVISTATVDAPKGSINGARRGYTIYTNDQLLSAAPWNDVIIAYKNGAAVRVRDVGVAVDGPENAYLVAWQNGHSGVQLQVFKQAGANVIETVKRVRATMAHAMLSVPPSVKLSVVIDRTVTIDASVRDVEFTLLLSIVLVVLVIFVFLRNAWATIIPGVTVPLSLLGTAALMYVCHYSLDNLSLMGLTIAVGFVVDDAIVMLENIYRHIEAGMPRKEAAIKGASEIGFTIISISLSLVAVFIPLLLMSGIMGRVFREFAITVTMTIAVSAFVALTLSPTMCALFLVNEHQVQHGRLYLMVERMFDAMVSLYTRGLDFVLRHQRSTLLTFAGTVALAVLLYVEIPKGFFPQQDVGLIQAVSDAPQDISFDQMVALHHRLTDIVASDPGVASYAATVGGGGRPVNSGSLVVGLKPRDQRDATADQIISRLRPKIAQIGDGTLFLQATQDLNVGARQARTQYQYTLQDADLEELDSWAPKMLQAMQKLPELRDVGTDQQSNAATLTMDIDRSQASRFGIQPSLIDATINDAFGQRQAAQYFTQLNAYHVVLEVTPSLQKDTDTLNKLFIRSPLTGQAVPISTLAHFDTAHVGFLSVNHQGQLPSVTLSFNLAPGVALGQAVDAIEKTAADLRLPAAIAPTFQGTAQAFQDSLRTEPYLIAAALVVVYIILGMLYESYIHPLTILSTLPSAGVGALLMLSAFHYELSLIGLIGIILLIGIVKKNGILMVDFAIQAEREERLEPLAAIRKACLLRFRPIMMTTAAALLSALPLMLENGTGSELRKPLGFAMVGGLILSQALTLFTTPVIYLYLERLSRHRRAALPHVQEVAASDRAPVFPS